MDCAIIKIFFEFCKSSFQTDRQRFQNFVKIWFSLMYSAPEIFKKFPNFDYRCKQKLCAILQGHRNVYAIIWLKNSWFYFLYYILQHKVMVKLKQIYRKFRPSWISIIFRIFFGGTLSTHLKIGTDSIKVYELLLITIDTKCNDFISYACNT